MRAVTKAGTRGQPAAGTSARREQQRVRRTQSRTRLESLPHDLLTRIASALPADGKKALRATCRLLRDATSAAINHIELTPEFDQALRAADRRRAACLHLGASFSAITSMSIHPLLVRAGTLVHKILRQLPNVASIKLLTDTSTGQRLTLRPLTLCPALPSTLRHLTIDTLHTSLAPLSQLTALTYIKLCVPRKHPPSILAPLGHLSHLHTCQVLFPSGRYPSMSLEGHPALLLPLANLASLRNLHLADATATHTSDTGLSVAPFTQLTSLGIASNSPTTVNSALFLTGLHRLVVVTDDTRLWLAGPRPSFPNLKALAAPLHLIQNPGAPHAPALIIFISNALAVATPHANPVSTFTAALANLPLDTLDQLNVTLPAPHDVPAFMRLLSGPAAPLLTGLTLYGSERHLSNLAPVLESLVLLPPSVSELAFEFSLTPEDRAHAEPQFAALADMRLYGHLPRLARLHVGIDNIIPR